MQPVPVKRSAFAAASLLASLTAAACGPLESKKVSAEDSESPEMWYRFKFEADYRGEPVRFDQYVACGLKTFPGGSLGATPSLTTRGMHPLAVGRRLSDGSHLVVRIPDLCLRNRRYNVHTDEIRAGRQAQWASPGPFTLLPLVIWNDRRPDTTLVEAYISPSYYRQPEARVRNLRASVEFLPAGQRPPNADAVAAQTDEPQYDPDPRSPEQRESWKTAAFQDRPEGMAAYATVPIPDLNAFAKRFGAEPLAAASKQDQPAFVRYDYYRSGRDMPPLGLQPDYVDPRTIQDCLHRLQIGEPAFSGLPPDPFDYQYYQTDVDLEHDVKVAAAARAKGEAWPTVTERRKLKAERRRKCFERLGEMHSFTLGEQGFEADDSPPGALIYRRWGGRGVKDFPFLRSKGATGPDGYPLLKLEGEDVRLNDQWMILQSRKSGNWYFITRIPSVFSSRLDG